MSSNHPASLPAHGEPVIDYVGYASELNAVAEKAAGVEPGDSDAVRAEKLHEWNLGGGLLQALKDGLYDVPSKVRGGTLRDGLQHDDLKPVAVTTLGVGDRVEGGAGNAEDLQAQDVVPVPNLQPWDDGAVAWVSGGAVRWDGDSWADVEQIDLR